MLVVHGTRKFLDRAGRPTAGADDTSTTRLGSWYATVLFWRPQVGLFVNETTLLPVLMPLAPAATVLARFPGTLERILTAHHASRSFVEGELAEMADIRLAKTDNRSVVGMMNDFARVLDAHRRHIDNLDELCMRLAHTPCGPLRKTHVFPDRALATLITAKDAATCIRQATTLVDATRSRALEA